MTSVHRIVTRSLVGACCSFFGMLAVCSLLYPQIYDHYNYGISYFGAVERTMLPYYLGFALVITCLAITARQLGRIGQRVHPLQIAFWSSTVLLAGIVLTSFTVDHTIFVIHAILDALLALNQLMIAAWVVRQADSTPLDYCLAAVFASIAILSALPLIHQLPVIRSFPLREAILFVSALGLMGRAALRATQKAT